MSGPTTKTPFPGIGSIGSATAGGASAATATHATNTADARIVGDNFSLHIAATPDGSVCRSVLEQQPIAGNWLGGEPSTSRAASTSLTSVTPVTAGDHCTKCPPRSEFSATSRGALAVSDWRRGNAVGDEMAKAVVAQSCERMLEDLVDLGEAEVTLTRTHDELGVVQHHVVGVAVPSPHHVLRTVFFADSHSL
jgi:hypothetical protein